MTATALHAPAEVAATTRKGVLFCPECGHESPIDGDWVIAVQDDRVATACPDCGAPLDDRPR